MQTKESTVFYKLKVVAVLFLISVFINFSYEQYFSSQLALSSAPPSMTDLVGPVSKDPIKDIKEISYAYAKLFGVDPCLLAKSMTGVFYVETGGRQNISGKTGKYVGSFQQGIPFVMVSRKYLGQDLPKIYKLVKQGEVPESTYKHMLEAVRQGEALGPSRGRKHHMYSTILALAQHARVAKAIQSNFKTPVEQAAAHELFQFAPSRIKYLLYTRKLNHPVRVYRNCGLDRTTPARGVNFIASGRSSCSPNLLKGVNKQTCGPATGYVQASGYGADALDKYTKVPPVSIQDYSNPDFGDRDYFAPPELFQIDPDDPYRDIQNQLQAPDIPSGDDTQGEPDSRTEEDSIFKKFEEGWQRLFFGENKKGTANPGLIQKNIDLYNQSSNNNSALNPTQNLSTSPFSANTSSGSAQQRWDSDTQLQNPKNNDPWTSLDNSDEQDAPDPFAGLDFNNSDDTYDSMYAGQGGLNAHVADLPNNSAGQRIQYNLSGRKNSDTRDSAAQGNPNNYENTNLGTLADNPSDSGLGDIDSYQMPDFIPNQAKQTQSGQNSSGVADLFGSVRPGEPKLAFGTPELNVNAQDLEEFREYLKELGIEEKEVIVQDSYSNAITDDQNKPAKQNGFFSRLWYIISLKWLFK